MLVLSFQIGLLIGNDEAVDKARWVWHGQGPRGRKWGRWRVWERESQRQRQIRGKKTEQSEREGKATLYSTQGYRLTSRLHWGIGAPNSSSYSCCLCWGNLNACSCYTYSWSREVCCPTLSCLNRAPRGECMCAVWCVGSLNSFSLVESICVRVWNWPCPRETQSDVFNVLK